MANDFIKHIEEGMQRFGMRLESSSAVQNDLQKLLFTDSIHNMGYVALARRSETRNPEDFWGDVIDSQLKELIKSTVDKGNPLPAALIVPSDEAEEVLSAAASKGIKPTVYQLFDGFVVVGFKRSDSAKLILDPKPDNNNLHEQVVAQNFTALETTDPESVANLASGMEPALHAEKTPEPEQAAELKRAIERATVTKRTPDPKPPQAPREKISKSKLLAAAILGVSIASIPYAINKIPGGEDAPITPDNREAIVEMVTGSTDGQQENKELQAALASNAPLPQYDLDQLIERGYVKEVAKNPYLKDTTIRQLATNPDDTVRASVASNKSLPINSINTLANDRSPRVRSSLAENPSIPPDILRKLSSDPEFAVRSGALANPEFTPDLLPLVESRVEDASCENREKIYAGKCASSEMIQYNADHPDPCIRRGIAKNPATPPKILDKLASDRDTRTRQNALKNPNLPEDALNELFSSGWEKTGDMDINAALSNPSLANETLSLAAQNPGKYGVNLASNPKAAQQLKRFYDQSSPKGGMGGFFNEVNRMPTDRALIEKLANENPNDRQGELRKEINKSFAKNVFDPATALNASSTAVSGIQDNPLALAETADGGEFFDTSGGSFTLAEMPETYEAFFDQVNAAQGRNSPNIEKEMVATADNIVSDVLDEISTPMNEAVANFEAGGYGNSAGGNLSDNDPLLMQAYQEAMPYGYGRSYSAGDPGNILSDRLFENSCESVDSLLNIL